MADNKPQAWRRNSQNPSNSQNKQQSRDRSGASTPRESSFKGNVWGQGHQRQNSAQPNSKSGQSQPQGTGGAKDSKEQSGQGSGAGAKQQSTKPKSPKPESKADSVVAKSPKLDSPTTTKDGSPPTQTGGDVPSQEEHKTVGGFDAQEAREWMRQEYQKSVSALDPKAILWKAVNGGQGGKRAWGGPKANQMTDGRDFFVHLRRETKKLDT